MHASDLFQTITAQLIADIEAGAGTWQMPWHRLADNGAPISADGRPYRTGALRYWKAANVVVIGWRIGPSCRRCWRLLWRRFWP